MNWKDTDWVLLSLILSAAWMGVAYLVWRFN